jgi:hypothetical protein
MRKRGSRTWVAFFVFVFVLLFGLPVRADDDKTREDTPIACVGPAECCITRAADVKTPLPTKARVGVRVMRVEKIAEQDGNFSGEITLMTSWKAGGLRPELNPRNAAEASYPLDETKLANGTCYRERRVIAKFQTWFRLRRFPFDRHDLRINLEDRTHPAKEITYENELWPNTVSIDALRELPAWKIPEMPYIHSVKDSTFAFPLESAHPQLVLLHLPVERHSSFYLTRFFLPLLLLVAIAYSIFWVRADDLQSSSAIGITCMLSIIAFQLAQADSLPRVPYLTIADRIYTVCYLLIAFTIACAVYEAYLFREGKEKKAERVDTIGRKWFPVLAVVLATGSSLWGWYVNSAEDADVFIPPARTAPAGAEN